MKKFLIIQTAFPGDVILATALAESLHASHPGDAIDFLVRKGNEGLLDAHPFIQQVIVWDKSKKLSSLISTIGKTRKKRYDVVINLQRFFSSGLITALSGAREKRGFDKNPLSFFYSKKSTHVIGNGKHETDRNYDLISDISAMNAKPSLYPSDDTFEKIQQLYVDELNGESYSCIAPASVWFTKQLPKEKWIELIKLLSVKHVFLLGSKSDKPLCEAIQRDPSLAGKRIINLAGELSFLESAALMKEAFMNFVNDSAPLHIASAMNAPVTAIFCSTIPGFGFGPLSTQSKIIQTKTMLTCKPCGLHGLAACPEGHFKCSLTIDMKDAAV